MRLTRRGLLEDRKKGNVPVPPGLDGLASDASPGELEASSTFVVIPEVLRVDCQSDEGIWEAAVRFRS